MVKKLLKRSRKTSIWMTLTNQSWILAVYRVQRDRNFFKSQRLYGIWGGVPVIFSNPKTFIEAEFGIFQLPEPIWGRGCKIQYIDIFIHIFSKSLGHFPEWTFPRMWRHQGEGALAFHGITPEENGPIRFSEDVIRGWGGSCFTELPRGKWANKTWNMPKPYVIVDACKSQEKRKMHKISLCRFLQ